MRGSGGLAPVGDGGGPRAHAELGVDPADVVLDGLLGQEQAGGDLPVGLAVRDEGHNLCLAGGQPVRFPRAIAGRVESGPLASVRPRDLPIIHLTSGCGRRPGRGPDRSERTKHGRYRVNPMKIHANEHMGRYGPT